MRDDDGNWHMDRRVPIALIVALAAHAATTVWWGATLTSRVTTLEEKILASGSQESRIVRLEESTRHITTTLEEVRQDVKLLIRRLTGPN